MDVLETPEIGFESLPLRLAYTFLGSHGLGPQAEDIKNSRDRLGSYTTSLKRAKIVAVLRENGFLDDFIKTKWRYALTDNGKRKLARYDAIYSNYETSGATGANSESGLADDEARFGTEFALEEHLRDYLAENLALLEPGLSQWPVDNGDAVEYQVDDQGPSRRIDILGKDKNGIPVVIELKVSRGHERVIGQALYYRARIKQRFRVHQVRVFIVTAETSPELRSAASEVADIRLFEYSLAVTIKPTQSDLPP